MRKREMIEPRYPLFEEADPLIYGASRSRNNVIWLVVRQLPGAESLASRHRHTTEQKRSCISPGNRYLKQTPTKREPMK
jgi:hypothetical protein